MQTGTTLQLEGREFVGGADFAAGKVRWRFPAALRTLRPGLLLAGLFVSFLIVAALWPSLLVSGDPLAASARDAFRAPSAAHWLGTDENGRDILTRLIYGVRPSLLMGIAATVIGLMLGVAIGLLAGLGHRLVDSTLMRGIDVLLAFPDLLLALVIITFWGQGMFNAVVAIGIASVPRYARLIRAQTHAIRHAQYVEAATTLGLRPITLIFRHILPNSIKPVLILAAIGVGGKIAAGAALSFLGFGAPPPSPEWGAMLSVGRNFISNAWWIVTAPALAITLTVISITALGRQLLLRSEGKAE
ncbi:peptide ABC transporter permease [Oxalicibacterium flavum]|uniref:Peptide ABC transporter permease n=1 Tax=Oxalicibacterium flavum TaxID=179467 RepID=A0A8J2UNV6_9BURK|nr:ABC transporter permease [Oxalicibacterium flavum]GGC16150.1 peptide ABC transporter permease [Oxalicibacterium flavum]